MNDPAAANAALNAFLRGVERRGAVFAEWQGGDAQAGDGALAATLRGFREAAAGIPFAEWPRRFWAMLLASPQLRLAAGAATVDAAPGHVARLGSGPRAALLLRLVAGLAEADAAAVLGIARPTYRLALQRALPHLEDGSPDPEAWRALSETAQRAIRALPGERLELIGMLRDGVRPRPARPARPAQASPDARRRWLWPATIAVAVLTAAALAATWWPWGGAGADLAGARIVVEQLPPEAAPAARFDPGDALATHRDLELLLAQASGGFDDDADPAFDAWLVANMARPQDAPPTPTETSDADEASPEQFDAPR